MHIWMIGKAHKKQIWVHSNSDISDVFYTFLCAYMIKSLKLIKVKSNTFLAVAFADMVWVWAIGDAQWVLSV